MSRQTTNYGLTKPDYTDTADIEVVNSNMDIIDEALKVIDTKSNNVMSKNSSAWSSTVAYAVGQYCIYNNSLWKCLVQHSGQTPQEGTYWARVSLDTLDSEINALNSNFEKLDGLSIRRGSFMANLSVGINNIKIRGSASDKVIEGTLPSSCNAIINTFRIYKENSFDWSYHFDSMGSALYIYTNIEQQIRFEWIEFL